MISREDAARMAMNREEAALMPALPRKRSIAGQTALREKLNAAAQMEKKQVSGEFHRVEQKVKEAGEKGRSCSRAALHHVLR